MKKTLLALAGMTLALAANADKYWIHGEVFGGGWNSKELTLNESTGKYELLANLGTGNFGVKITNDAGTQFEGAAGWYSAPNGTQNISEAGTYSIQNSNNTNFSSSLNGFYTISLDWEAKKLTFEPYSGEVETSVSYELRGNCFGGDWEDKEMTESDGVWSWTGNLSQGNMGIKHMVNGRQATWLWGKEGNLEISANGTFDVVPESENGGNFDVKVSGEYTLTFNPESMQLSVEGEGVVDTSIPVYLMNSINGYNAGTSTRMKAEDDGSYSFTLANAGPDTHFKVMARVNGTDKWFAIDGDDGQNLPDGTYTFGLSGTEDNMTLENGGDEVTFTVRLTDNNTKVELTIAGQTPSDPSGFPPIYLISSKIGNAAIEENRLSTEDGLTYTITKQNFSGDLPFHFFGRDSHQHRFSNAQQNMKNGEYELTAGAEGEMTLDNGGDVTFTFVLAEDHSSAKLTIEGQVPVEDTYPRMYLVGERTEWIATEPYRMQTEDGITYTLELDDMSTKPFRFTGDSWNIRSLGNGGVKLADGTYDLTKSETNMSLLKGGKVKYTLVQENNFETAKLTIEGQGEVETSNFAKMYIVGSMTTWADDPIEMTTADGINYEVTVPGMTTLDEFKFFGGAWGTRELSGAGGGLANGEYSLSGTSANMTLAIGGDVTFQLVLPEGVTPETKIIDSARLTISGQEGDVPEAKITYALRGEFFKKDEWKDIPLAKAEDSDVWSATFTSKYTEGSFGVARFVNGIQPNENGWFSAPVTFDADNLSAELVGGGNCVFALPANVEYTVKFDTETNILTFSYEGETPDDPEQPTDLTLYVIGDAVPETGWTVANDAYKFSSTDGKTFTLTCSLEGGKGFKIYPGNWEDTAHNFGGAGTDLENGTFDVYADSGDMTLKYGGDNVTLTLVQENNFEKVTLTISGQDENIVVEKEVTYHLHGQWDGEDWQTIDLVKQNDNTWTALYTPQHSGGNFGVKKCENGTQVEWYNDDHLFDENNHTKTLSAEDTGNCTFGYAANTPCTFTFNPETMELAVKKDTQTDISSISEDAEEAIYFNLQGVRVHNPESGLYIKVVNGKSDKVLVK